MKRNEKIKDKRKEGNMVRGRTMKKKMGDETMNNNNGEGKKEEERKK